MLQLYGDMADGTQRVEFASILAAALFPIGQETMQWLQPGHELTHYGCTKGCNKAPNHGMSNFAPDPEANHDL